MLPDWMIRDGIDAGKIAIHPYDEDLINSASIDVRLGRNLYDPTCDMYFPIPDDGYELSRGAFLLGSTIETITVPSTLLAVLWGKSSLGRLGLVIHQTAGLIDPGFTGQITLELANVSPTPVRLYEGMRIGQITFQVMQAAPAEPYGSTLDSHYQGQKGPTPAWNSQVVINLAKVSEAAEAVLATVLEKEAA